MCIWRRPFQALHFIFISLDIQLSRFDPLILGGAGFEKMERFKAKKLRISHSHDLFCPQIHQTHLSTAHET